MTEDEKKIYNTLPDAASKKAFIEEFRNIRDPDPSTEENENRTEFENRIAFANEWFGNWKTFAGRSMGNGQEKDRGWKTSRGRVYIVLTDLESMYKAKYRTIIKKNFSRGEGLRPIQNVRP